MVLGILFVVALCLVWGAAGFVIGYRLARRRTPIRFIPGRIPQIPLDNSVSRMPGPADENRRYDAPDWMTDGR